MPDTSETVLEIDLGALEHNYKYLRSKIRPGTRFMAVVKAFAYGTDTVRIAQTLERAGVDYFAVAYVKEGAVLRDAGIKAPILVLHPQPVNFDLLIERCLEPSIYSPKILREFLSAAKAQQQKSYPVHLKFNTGLNRLGFWENDIDYIQETLKNRSEIKVISVFSHLAASEDESEKEFTAKQINSFKNIAEEVDDMLGYRPFRHILNTSGIINYPEAQFDLVRSGIGLYGYGNDPAVDRALNPVATLKTIISQIHKIEPDESVGYNRAFRSDHYRVTATLPIGHADGIGRHYGGGKAHVFIGNKKAPIIGNVCMDMIMIDITNINCKEGDEVVIFGKEHSAEDLAASAGTISYELITGISLRVPRIFFPEVE
ncbi:MAG: alanine racemase [Eudoraea sp.]|nr:alanine racemase [Eudoraea sp.]